MSEKKCTQCGIVLVKDVNWLPGCYACKGANGRTYERKRCRDCHTAQAKKSHLVSYTIAPHVQQFERQQRAKELGKPLCSNCWANGVETVLIVGVSWHECRAKRKQYTCITCQRNRCTKFNRKKGHMPRNTDRSLLDDYYCYALIDEHGSTYYIGMGRGDRVNDHLRDTQSKLAGKKKGKRGMLLYTEKEKRIIRCLDSPEGYRYVKLVTGLTQAQAFDAEAFWIEVYGQENLTNIAKPRSRGKPPIPAFQIKDPLPI